MEFEHCSLIAYALARISLPAIDGCREANVQHVGYTTTGLKLTDTV